MKITKLSASAVKSSESCLSRYKTERDAGRNAREDKHFNLLGSAVHETLEYYVDRVIRKEELGASLETVKILYIKSYLKWFGSADQKDSVFKDGLELVENWFNRTIFDFDIISLEEYRSFQLPLPDGTEIPFNYIIDRLDKLESGVYRVVDYKTSRAYMSPEDLAADIQARMYGLAIQIENPDATEVEVMFDMLRHQPVAVTFSKSDNRETWKLLKDAAAYIFEAPEDNPKESLNKECTFCIKKSTCKAVASNSAAGGIHSLSTIEKLVEARTQLAFQEKAAQSAKEEIDTQILNYMQEHDVFSFATPTAVASAKVSNRRYVNSDEVLRVVGPEIFGQHGGHSISIKGVESLLDSGLLDEGQTKAVSDAIEFRASEPRIETKLKTRFS